LGKYPISPILSKLEAFINQYFKNLQSYVFTAEIIKQGKFKGFLKERT